MKSITLISTIHSENGKCNAEELCHIINSIKPEIIFLEALEDTYTEYQKSNFINFNILHKKLEVKAIQIYSLNNSFKYLPVLDIGLSEQFDKKYNSVCKNVELQILLENFNFQAGEEGFEFLNSVKAMDLQKEMRDFETRILSNNNLNIDALDEIDRYENNMLKNIYGFCESNNFQSAIFMCGVAHRTSLIEKITHKQRESNEWIHWSFFGQ
jgi:hypothetical protein